MSSMIISELLSIFGLEVDERGFKKLDQRLEQVKKTAENASQRVQNAFNIKADKGLGKLSVPSGPLNTLDRNIQSINQSAVSARNSVLMLFGAFSLGSLGLGGMFRLMGSMEQTEIAFETMIGSAEKAKRTLEDLKSFSKMTPFSFAETSDLSKQLLAFSFQAEDLIPTMTALGNIAAGVGKERLPQLVLALGQVKTAGKLRGQELNQFTQAGVPLLKELSKTLGVAENQVQSLVERGQVGFKEVWQSLQAVTGEGGRFNNLMARQSQSLLGMWSNLTDTIQLLAVDLGKRGLLARAKELTQSFIDTLTTHREEILDGMAHAIDLLIEALDGVIKIAKGAWRVFSGLSAAIGGPRKAIELMIKGLLLLTGARMIFILGKFAQGIYGVAAAWRVAGAAGLIAQAELLAIPLAIGAAIIGLALLIEDVVAYFQGRKSITGLILGDLSGISTAFSKLLDPVLSKLQEFGKSIGKFIIQGISNLSAKDFEKLGEFMMKAIEVLLNVAKIPFDLGLAIAKGIVQGMVVGIREKFPSLAKWLGIDDQLGTDKNGNKFFSDLGAAVTNPSTYTRPLVDGLLSFQNLLPEFARPNLSSPLPPVPPSLFPPSGAVNLNVNTQINVPPGTPPEAVGPAVESGVRKSLDDHLRSTKRAAKPAFQY